MAVSFHPRHSSHGSEHPPSVQNTSGDSSGPPQQPGPRSRLLDLAVNAVLLGLLWLAYVTVRRVTADDWGQAFFNSGRVLQLQQALGLPSERAFQSLLLGHRLIIRAANSYYMWAHFPVTVAFLTWSFFAHRHRFGAIRNTFIAVTGAGLVLHLLYPLAPPRKLPGFIDTGVVFGPSPYDLGASEAANQIAAMPSLHVAWAVIVAIGTVTLSRGRWRYLAIAHAVITALVVVLTANHYWIDVIVALLLVAGAKIASDWLQGGTPVRLPQFRNCRRL